MIRKFAIIILIALLPAVFLMARGGRRWDVARFSGALEITEEKKSAQENGRVYKPDETGTIVKAFDPVNGEPMFIAPLEILPAFENIYEVRAYAGVIYVLDDNGLYSVDLYDGKMDIIISRGKTATELELAIDESAGIIYLYDPAEENGWRISRRA